MTSQLTLSTHQSIKVYRKTQPQSVIAFDTRERNNNAISDIEASLPVKLPCNNHLMITLVGNNSNAAHQKSPRRNHDHPYPNSSAPPHQPGRSATPGCQSQSRKTQTLKRRAEETSNRWTKSAQQINPTAVPYQKH